LPHWTLRLDQLGMTRHEIVTLASIIEGEAPHEADRPYVSSVYHNRLERGMRLQADPTVIYALGGWRRLSRDDLAVQSPYNTYRVNGLPPGPINQPSTASIVAALYPAPSEYLYFVADASGRHYFTHTYRQHLSMIRQIRNGDTMPGRGATN
ncbi:MAG: endolytic transglycosylase MltG, partial [Gemmatimonadota bacterium]